MERILRIMEMEAKLNASLAAVRAMEQALEDYRNARKDIRDLSDYLSGPDWREDLAADEAGLLPRDLRRGVLSEDGIFNLLEEDRELTDALRALAAEPEAPEE